MKKFTTRCKCNTYIDSLSPFEHKGSNYFYCHRCNLYYDSNGNIASPKISYTEAKKSEDEAKKREQKKLLRSKYDEKVKEFYHITHKNNIENILKCGILPKNKVDSKKIDYTDCSMEEVQKRREERKIRLSDGRYFLHDVVPLYFTSRTPTYYKMIHKISKNDFCFIVVSRDIVDDDGVAYAFSDGNLGSYRSETYDNIIEIDKLDWKVINMNKAWKDDNEKRKRCAEFLISPVVQPRHFLKILVRNSELKKQIDRILIELNLNISVEIDSNNKYF